MAGNESIDKAARDLRESVEGLAPLWEKGGKLRGIQEAAEKVFSCVEAADYEAAQESLNLLQSVIWRCEAVVDGSFRSATRELAGALADETGAGGAGDEYAAAEFAAQRAHDALVRAAEVLAENGCAEQAEDLAELAGYIGNVQPNLRKPPAREFEVAVVLALSAAVEDVHDAVGRIGREIPDADLRIAVDLPDSALAQLENALEAIRAVAHSRR